MGDISTQPMLSSHIITPNKGENVTIQQYDNICTVIVQPDDHTEYNYHPTR
jgi:hypothetical protein